MFGYVRLSYTSSAKRNGGRERQEKTSEEKRAGCAGTCFLDDFCDLLYDNLEALHPRVLRHWVSSSRSQVSVNSVMRASCRSAAARAFCTVFRSIV